MLARYETPTNNEDKMNQKRQRTATQSDGTSLVNGFTIGVVVAVVIGAMMIFTIRSGSEDAEVETGFTETAPVEVVGTPLSDFDANITDPEIGNPAPSLVGVDFNGNESQVETTGSPQAVLFVAHWCPHCQNEVPVVRALRASDTWPADVKLTTIATSTSSTQNNYPPSAWLAREGLTVLSDTVLVDSESGDALHAYGGSGFPYWVFLDASGNVVMRSSGELGEQAIKGIVDTLAG